MDLNTITVQQFQSYFSRDFPYSPFGTSTDNSVTCAYVTPADISKAFLQAQVNLNQSLFSSDANITMAYLYLTAHYLSVDLRMALGGIESSGVFNVSSRSVGSVSESYAIPARYENDPVLSFYTTTGYGMKYLSLVLPQLIGNMVGVCGGTNP